MSNDLVERWKSNALQRVAERQRSAAPSTFRATQTARFVALATMVGASWHFGALEAGPVGQLKAPLTFILLTLGALASVQILSKAYAEHQDHAKGVEKLAAQAELLLAEGNATLAARVAEHGLATVLSPDCRARLWTCCAWAAIAGRDPFLAHRALGELPTNRVGPHLVASYLNCCNRTDEAIELLEQARERGDKTTATAKLLIDLHFRLGNVNAVVELARSEAAILSTADRSAIEAALARARVHETVGRPCTEAREPN